MVAICNLNADWISVGACFRTTATLMLSFKISLVCFSYMSMSVSHSSSLSANCFALKSFGHCGLIKPISSATLRWPQA